MNQVFTKETVKDALSLKLSRYFGVNPEDANKEQIYKATILTVKDILTQKRSSFKHKVKKEKAKKIYYLCMEFLIGRSLKNNLRNLGIADYYAEVLKDYGFDIDEIYEMEPDPGLGNGGLGRLAACFMDSLTSLNYPGDGFSILYEYGLFKQKIIDGNQVELPDNWLPGGEEWLVPRTDKKFTIRFGGQIKEEWENGKLVIKYENYEEVEAVPYDMMVSGAGTAVNRLRLWKAHDITNFNMSLFSQGQYVKAIQQSSNAEVISKVLYPSDEHTEGKLLRLTQQYFLVSASLQSIISDHLAAYGSMNEFADKVAIHINDTHPALCVPELMRILMDVYNYTWDDAWYTVTKTISYTNHTVMPEALECWNEDLFSFKLPRIHSIVKEINRRFCADLWNAYPGDWGKISRMAIIGHGQVRMANLSVVGSHTVNGVSALHSNILKKTVFHDFYKYTPDKFTNVTNGIAHRRWLSYSNPQLASLITECIGDGFVTNPCELENLLKYADDKNVISKLHEIKENNKIKLSKYVFNKTGFSLDTSSVFDVQVKRMHEYKRQLLNALKIIAYYNEIEEHPEREVTKKTFIFGGKAAPGYYMAKDIIKLIWNLGEDIRKNPRVKDKLAVVYLEDYNVSTAEVLMPASEISEQISLAGKEASGTGCMKFMMNGALTIGTLDGANVEMKEAVGDDNIYIFGLTAKEVDELWEKGYRSIDFYNNSVRIKKAIDRLNKGFNGVSFANIANYLIGGFGGVADPYMCLADFDSYYIKAEEIFKAYNNKTEWGKMSLVNIAKSGFFAADRSIKEYSDKIWHLTSVK